MHAGFPHSDIRGSKLMCSSPRLFAAYHVFHRLPVPGHPPCALLCLTSLYHPRSPRGSLGRSKFGSYTLPQANLRCVSFMFFSLACYCFLDLRVIESISVYIYQRRGLMFDVSDLISRSNLSLIQFSRYETYISDMYPDALHVISTQEWLPGCSSHAKQHVL